MMASLIIPACNEAVVIGRCLRSIIDDPRLGDLDVVVACNGCTDDTAGVARSLGDAVTVVELSEPSKTAALNAADRVARGFPRIYLDADVVLSPAALVKLIQTLASDDVMAARPPVRHLTDGASLVVRCYYAARERCDSVMQALWGAGVYGLSRPARARFDDFPSVIADDLFVDRHFADDEICIVDCEPVDVRVPRTARQLLRVLRRNISGARQSPDAGGVGYASARRLRPRDLIAAASTSPRAMVDCCVYVTFVIVARAALTMRPLDRWERDDSTRQATVDAAA